MWNNVWPLLQQTTYKSILYTLLLGLNKTHENPPSTLRFAIVVVVLWRHVNIYCDVIVVDCPHNVSKDKNSMTIHIETTRSTNSGWPIYQGPFSPKNSRNTYHSQGSFCIYVPSQWETTLHCNVVSHWLGAYILNDPCRACPWWRAIGYISWVLSLTKVLPLSLFCCVQYCVIMDQDISII